MTPIDVTQPLAGLRVIEVSSFVAAPLGGLTLAQLGAEVVRVDPLGGAADHSRWPIAKSGTSLYWSGLNKGKQSFTVDMRSGTGRELVRELVRSCPPGTAVVLTNAVGQEWLSYESLRAVAHDLVHVQVRGRSDGSPAVDYTVNAEVGFPMITGPAGHADPINHVLPAWDIACGLYAATGVAAAALRREATGEGAALTVALADVALSMAGNLGFIAEAQVNQVERGRIGNYLYGGFARDFECRDGGRVMVVALTGRHWKDLIRMTDTESSISALEISLGADFGTEGDRFEYREVLAGLISRWFAHRDESEVVANMAETSLVWAPYRTFGQMASHLATASGHNPIVSAMDQPGVGRHLVPGCPIIAANRPRRSEPAPALGEHTSALLRDRLGFTSERISELVRRGVVAGAACSGTNPPFSVEGS